MQELPERLRFLKRTNVDRLHAEALAKYGGQAGVSSMAALESAVMMPQQGFGGHYLHEDLAAMAAAYLYHIAEGQPYTDGNKRTGVLAAVTFLGMNGVNFKVPQKDMYQIAIGCAKREGHTRLTKDDVIDFFRQNMPQADS